ncbi:MAG: DUF6452 family protein [Bacteroidota bacterium]
MKNYKNILFFILITILVSCEKDDICLEENTPKLIIRFYDNENPALFKNVSNLAIRIEGLEGFYVNEGISTTTDSIAVPLEVVKDFTKIELILNGADEDADNDNSDFIDVNYNRTDEFISRSCGFKTIYNTVEFQLNPDTEEWIKIITPVESPQNITNEKNRHVKIFH